MNLDTLLPALQEMNGRLEGIAQLLTNQSQILVDGEERQREVARIQQKLVNLQEQTIKRAPDRQGTPAQNDQVVGYLKEILNGINFMAETAQKQAEAGHAPGSTPMEGQFERIRQLLQDIKERLGDLATGVPASKDEYIDHQREELVNDIYSKMQAPPQPPAPARRPTSRAPSSNVESTAPPETPSWGTTPRTAPEQPPIRQSRVPPSILPEVDPKAAERVDAIFTEEAAYLDEKKTHLDKQEKYLDERKEHIAQKKEWYLNFG